MSVGSSACGMRFSQRHSAEAREHRDQQQQRRPAQQPAPGQPFDEQLQRAERHRDQQRAGPVQAHLALVLGMAQVRQVAPHEEQRQQADRQVHVEHRAPAEGLREKAAERRADRVGDAEGGAHQHLPAQAHDRIGEQVGHAGERGAHQHPAADALQHPRGHQEAHAARHPAQHRGGGEHHDRGDHEGLAAVIVAQPAEDRHGDHRGQQVGGRDPRVQIEAAQLGHDGRQRGADHGLVEGDQHRDEGNAQHCQQGFTKRQDLPTRMVGSGMDGHLLIAQRLTSQRLRDSSMHG